MIDPQAEDRPVVVVKIEEPPRRSLDADLVATLLDDDRDAELAHVASQLVSER